MNGLSGGVVWSKPPGLVCHICGREYGTASLAIHLPQCARLWRDRQKLLPKSERRPVPKATMTIQQMQSLKFDTKDPEAMQKFNEAQFTNFVEKSLVQCQHCGRRFLEEKLPVHQRSCTVDRPAAAVGSHRIKEADPFNKAAKNAAIAQLSSSAYTGSSGGGGDNINYSTKFGGGIKESKSVDDLPIPRIGYDLSTLPDESGGEVAMAACSICQRHFAADRVTKHEAICAKSHNKSVAKPQAKSQPSARPSTSAPSAGDDGKWKSKHADFQAAIQYAKQLTKMQAAGVNLASLPPPPRSENPDYVQCPHCSRRFNLLAAERHIPACANTVNKPKPPPQLRPKTAAAASFTPSRGGPALTSPAPMMSASSNLSVIKTPLLKTQTSPRTLNPLRPKTGNKPPNSGAASPPPTAAASGVDVGALQSQLQALTATVSMLSQHMAPKQAAGASCRACQTSLHAGARFCSNCGSPQS